MNDTDEIVSEFLAESREHLDQLEHDLIELEENPTSSELIASIFRAAHTIKGACGFLGFRRLELLIHAEETLLSQVRSGRRPPNSETIALLLVVLDRTRAILSEVETSGEDGHGTDSDLIERLTDYTIPPPLWDLSAEEGDKPLGQLLADTAGVSQRAINAALDAQKKGDTRRIGEILVEQGAASRSLIRNVVEYQNQVRAKSVADTSVRIEFAVLSGLASEINKLQDVRDQLLLSEQSNRSDEHGKAMRRLARISNELKALVLKSFQQPIGSIWMQLSRVARDIATAQGKQVRLDMDGQNVQVDRRILEAIKDPLIHLVRNSIDHGIESPDMRLAAGKSIQGRVWLRAFHGDRCVTIEVADDGAGIDLDRVRAKALGMGVINELQASLMDKQELADLIFVPGLSTAQRVTRHSGRGVGMDIVRTNLEAIGGAVRLTNCRDQGLKVKISLPLTALDEPIFSTS